MKIVFIGNCYPPAVVGGAEIAMQHIAQACRDLGHEVLIVTLNTANFDILDDVNGLPVHRLKTRNLYWPFAPSSERSRLKKVFFHLRDLFNPAAARAVRAIVLAEKPDVVSTHNLVGFSVSIWRMLRKLGVPVVHTLHDYHLMCVTSTRFRRGEVCRRQCGRCKLASIVRKIETRQVANVIGVSRHVLSTHADAGYFSSSEKSVVYNGVPLTGVSAVARKIGEPFRVGFIGRIEPAKGIEVLLEALRLIAAAPLEVRIAGRGEPEYLKGLQERFADPRVRYVGYVNAAEFYSALDVVVVPSIWEEPLGLVAIEPLEFGVPVIGARIGGIAELVEHGRTGLLVEPGDPNGLARAIEDVRAGRLLGPELNANCRAARQRYLPEAAARAMCDILERAVSSAKAIDRKLS